MPAYYNEFDPYAAQWLRNLIAAGHIPAGDVDERSITEVPPDDLKSYTQCHFFAGLGGWAYALRLAGWADDRPVWTGSCPCQPFSATGRQQGQADERHLWPVWFRLIRESHPAIVFGEQVASAIAFGWLDEVATDMEGEGYAIGSAVLPACSVAAPHRRDRLWFVANAEGKRRQQDASGASRDEEANVRRRKSGDYVLAGDVQGNTSATVGNAEQQRLEGYAGDGNDGSEPGRQHSHSHGSTAEADTYWTDCEWIDCPDGKARPVKPGVRLLAHGIPARVGALKGYGNAIVPQVAAEFIIASSTPNLVSAAHDRP